MFWDQNNHIFPKATKTSYFQLHSIFLWQTRLRKAWWCPLCADYRVGSWIINITLLLLFLHACQKTKGMVISNWRGELAGYISIFIQLWKPYKHDHCCKHNVDDIFFHCKNILLLCVYLANSVVYIIIYPMPICAFFVNILLVVVLW
jgi:hypothetical protein